MKGSETGMKYMKIAQTDLEVSRLALGCMRLSSRSLQEAEQLIGTALNLGINFFDHADIYGGGECERLFGQVLAKHPEWREKMVLQSKCGIVPGVAYDLSREHILAKVKESLANLQTDHLDVLLLHRPDALMDPREVARAFDECYAQGWVRYFGVSNMNPRQIELIGKYSAHPLVINQLQFNLVNSGMIDTGINVNMKNAASLDHDDSVLDYCYYHEMTIQPWSILQASWEEGSFIDHPDYAKLNQSLEEMGQRYGLSKAAMSVAWILRHPAMMQPIAGTTSVTHLQELAKACDVTVSREDWYQLYMASGKTLP